MLHPRKFYQFLMKSSIFLKVSHPLVLAWKGQGGPFPVLELLAGLLISNPQNRSLKLRCVQVNKVLLTQQGRQAAWLGAHTELPGLWFVPSVPGSNMK